MHLLTVVGPGFPVGGMDLLGGRDLQCGHFLVKMYAKMKELDAVGGGMHWKFLYVDAPLIDDLQIHWYVNFYCTVLKGHLKISEMAVRG